ncbi:MAG TPA: hypothetical protein VF503_00140 [Sphingobium sp.]|uniref:hypothetical protein n=1 Tax=Sphingobium sp. TaxID=1912891 RepID=UPI002ED2E427
MKNWRYNPLYHPLCATPHRVRQLTGVAFWPKGLHWFEIEKPSHWRNASQALSYTIKSKGRTGAKARQALMSHKPFVVAA